MAALNWTQGLTQFLVDGAVVSEIASPCLLNELGVDFDRETMPGWMILPPPSELPAIASRALGCMRKREVTAGSTVASMKSRYLSPAPPACWLGS